jgi:hypothetical protein
MAVRVVDVVAKRKCAVGDDGNLVEVDAPFDAPFGARRSAVAPVRIARRTGVCFHPGWDRLR